MDDKVLDYHDVLLRRADVELLDGPFWVNDQIIGFYFQYLPLEKYPTTQGDVMLISGSVAFLLLHANESDASLTIRKLGIAEKKAVLFAVNNNPHIHSPGGGSHWSLLLYLVDQQKFCHFDSVGHTNLESAKRLAKVVEKGVGMEGMDFINFNTPQQNDGWMCGYYTMQIADTACDLASVGQLGDVECLKQCIKFDVENKLPLLQEDLKATIGKISQRQASSANIQV